MIKLRAIDLRLAVLPTAEGGEASQMGRAIVAAAKWYPIERMHY